MIQIWTDGHMDIRVSYACAKLMAGYLRSHGWGVRWMPDIGVLALFSPGPDTRSPHAWG